ncbi:MAG: 30S ribosomal protein S16 [Anaerolineaceae bacterium 4572_32.1]|nr:MAG: 30S ribosomal protein S16 [Anaerolineaceae bacterium 4572_32.1]
MVRIRLRRVGAKKQPSYRVVVADQRAPRDGRFIEWIGWYNPRTDPPSFKIAGDRALHWLSVGAQPSEAVARLLKKMGLFEQLERVKAGASIEEVMAEMAEAAKAEAEEAMPESKEALPTEAEIEAEEAADDIEEIDEPNEIDETEELDEVEKVSEESDKEEETA